MKKIIGAVLILSLLLALPGSICVNAQEEPTIYYSVDKSKWYEIPSSDFIGNSTVDFAVGGEKNVKVYTKNGVTGIDISDKTQFVYLYAEAPEGASLEFYTTIDTKQSLEPWGDLVDGGVWAWEKESKYAKYPVRVSGGNQSGNGPLTAVSVPLRLGRVDVYAVCNQGGNESVYKVSMNGSWTAAANYPKISDINSGFRVYVGNAAGYAIPMSGASLANDNQTYLFTYSKYRVGNNPGNWGEQTMWVGSNFTKWLEGSSYVMMPGHGIAPCRETYNKVTTKFFDISVDKTYTWSSGDKKISGYYGDDYIGEVIILMPNRADKNSEYYTKEGWECVNSGNTPKAEGATFSPVNRPRNYNDFEDNVNPQGTGDNSSKYYGVAVEWNNKSGYRENFPGVDGELSTESYKKYVELNYAYRKRFCAGDIVSVYSPANIANNDEADALIVPIIKFYMPEETADIKDVEAKYLASGDGVPSGGAVAVNVTTLIGNYTYGRNVTATYSLYDENGAIPEVVPITTEAMTTSDEFIFPCAQGRAKYLHVIFKNDNDEIISERKQAIDP